MRTLQKSNLKYYIPNGTQEPGFWNALNPLLKTPHKSGFLNSVGYILMWLFVMISGCATHNPPIPEKVRTGSVSASEDLSTKTVVPVGFEKFLGIFTPYRVTVQQGNFVSNEMAVQVKEGMTREQVRFLLGTALLTDMFHADRWDYIFRLLKPSGELITSRVTIYFDKSLVSKIERGVLPNEQEYLTRITNAAIVNDINHVDRTSDKPTSKKND